MRLNILNHLSRVANGLVCLATHNFSENGADDYRAAFTSARELVVGQVSKIVWWNSNVDQLIHVFSRFLLVLLDFDSCIFMYFCCFLGMIGGWSMNVHYFFLELLDFLPPILPCVTLWQTNIAIEHGHRNSWFTHEKLSFSIVFPMFTRGYTMLSIPSGKPTVCYGKSQCLISIHSGTFIYINQK